MVWILFLLLIFCLLALDLGIFHKQDKQVSMKESLLWTGIWVAIALLFGVVIYYLFENNLFHINPNNITGKQALLEYLTGYVIEESLSMDNIFVIAMIFSYFKIELKYQHNILFWGIIGAVVFRLLMILLGTEIINDFEWSMYIFGAILIYSGIKMLKDEDETKDFKSSIGVKLLSKFYPIDWSKQDGSYFTKTNNVKSATILLVTLIVVEFTDILFAIDSIPAIFSVTKNSFLVFSSNIFAILGLRNLYFFLSNMIEKFQHVKYSLVLILCFIGLKMILEKWIKIPISLSLLFILLSLSVGIIYSWIKSNKSIRVN